MGSFVKHDNSNKSNVANKCNGVLTKEYWVGVEASYDPDGPSGPPIFMFPERFEFPKGLVPPGMEALPRV
jgi:hypothetical protein